MRAVSSLQNPNNDPISIIIYQWKTAHQTPAVFSGVLAGKQYYNSPIVAKCGSTINKRTVMRVRPVPVINLQIFDGATDKDGLHLH